MVLVENTVIGTLQADIADLTIAAYNGDYQASYLKK